MNLEDITMAQVLRCMTPGERQTLEAVLDTGGPSAHSGIASMLVKQSRADARQLMHGGSRA